MPFARDTFATLIDKNIADIAARLPGATPLLRRSVLNVLARVLAAAQNDQLGYLDWQARQGVPFTCSAEYLEGWAAFKAVYRKAATAAAGTLAIAGAQPDSVISAGVELVRQDNTLYLVTGGATVASNGTATIAATAELAGAGGDCDPGLALSFTAPIAGVPSTAAIVTMTGGADVENDAALRSRMLAAFAAPPQGGDLADYVNWALAVPGVTRAWAGGSSIMGPGTVSVYAMLDDANHTHGLPIGSNGVSQHDPRDTAASGDQLAIADYIFPLRPVTALVYGLAPVGDALNLTLAEVPVDTTIRAGIAAALNGFLLREASPGGATLADLSAGGTVRLSHLEAAIAAVPGLDHFILQAPVADIVAATGHIAVPGSISYV